MPFPRLFKKSRFGSLTAKNALVMPPMVRNYATTDGLVNPRYVAHIKSIAQGGVGTMILEASYISQAAKGFGNQLGIHNNKTIPGLKKLAAIAHKEGALIGVQVYHAGRQTSHLTTGVPCVAPSPIPDPTVNEVPHELSKKEISEIVAQYAAASLRAKKAGMDFVELHGAHGYLITQFLSPFSNKRKDEYGGSLKNRMRFMKEVILAVRKAVGPDFTVTIRLSGEESVPHGLHIQDTIKIAKAAEKLGVSALHISIGNYASYAKGLMIPPMATKEGPLVYLAAAVKKAVKIPVMTVAKIRDPKFAEQILKSKKADFIAIGRTLLADPEWPNKVKEGMMDEINYCITCNQGCITRLFAGQDVWCTVNPATSRELMFAKPKGKRKKVVIVGGGPAGMSAAKTAAERGHKVILIEKSKRLGGQLYAAAAAPHRQEWNKIRTYLTDEMDCWEVDVRLNTEVTPDLIKKIKPDAVIWAVGADPRRPIIAGIDGKQVVSSRDLLEGKVKAGQNVVVAGGGCSGAQTAEFLASKGKKVTILETTGDIALDAPSDERFLMLQRLADYKVKSLVNTKLTSILPGKIVAEGKKGKISIPTDTVVICMGSFSRDGYTDQVKRLVKSFQTVGDALQPRRVTEAIAEGALAALKI